MSDPVIGELWSWWWTPVFVVPLLLAFAAAVWRGLRRAKREEWNERRRTWGPRR